MPLKFFASSRGSPPRLALFRDIGGVLLTNQSKNNNQKTYDKYNYKNIFLEKPISPI